MRSLFALVLTSSLAACGGGTSPDHGVDAPAATVDAPGATNGFSIVTPDITIAAGQEITYCYYFHTSNTSPVIVKDWKSTLAPGSHHLIMYFQASNSEPDGYLDPTGDCGATISGNSAPIWTYASSQPTQETDMPSDDGTGKPVGMLIPVNQAAVMQLHYINSTDSSIIAHATINADGYPAGTTYTPAAAYVSYNDDIDIPPGAQNVTFTASCATPAGANFFTMSTHSHKQTVMDTVADSSGVFLTTTNWADPTVMNWGSPFFQLAGNSFTYSCTYDYPATGGGPGSNGTMDITSGPSAATNEMCMAVGYYFPAPNPKLCLEYQGHSIVLDD